MMRRLAKMDITTEQQGEGFTLLLTLDPRGRKKAVLSRLVVCMLLVNAAVMFDLLVCNKAILRSIQETPTMKKPIRLPVSKYYEHRIEVSDSSENILPSGFAKAKHRIEKSKRYGVCSVGAGLSGTVFAERAANVLGKDVLVIDSRPHIGGNCYDYVDPETGILRNQYGAHLFHTNIPRVWKYVTSKPQKAPKWRRWYHTVSGLVHGDYVPIPVNTQTVNRLMNMDIQTEEEMNEWLETVQIPCPSMSGCQNAEQMAKSRVGEELYELIFKGYTMKQWGKDPRELNASVTARIPVFSSFDARYFSDKHQALPGEGYTRWFEAFLDHPRIDVVLGIDFFDQKKHLEEVCEKIIYTGPIDRYFEAAGLEKLEYRSLVFLEERHYNNPGYIQPSPVVNYPGMETNKTRAVEYKQFLNQVSNHTLVVREVSSASGDPYYPVPTSRNLRLYEQYQAMAAELEASGKIIFAGRLANYKYFNMDQAIENALALFEKVFGLKLNDDFEGGSGTALE